MSGFKDFNAVIKAFDELNSSVVDIYTFDGDEVISGVKSIDHSDINCQNNKKYVKLKFIDSEETIDIPISTIQAIA